MPKNDKTCFIIMPITTPDTQLEKYRDGSDHFMHVLQCLFTPSVLAAGYEPITPIAKGSDLIHAEIIRNLEMADLVLCDMSCLNPNVFFEFGIRTSLNKSVCVVKDEHTQKIPFDTGILNYQEYKSSIEPWELENEIKKLAEHIRVTEVRSKGVNTLWRYFGLRSSARPYEGETGTDAKLDYLSLQIDSLKDKIGEIDKKTISKSSLKWNSSDMLQQLYNFIGDRIDGYFELGPIENNRVKIFYKGLLGSSQADKLAVEVYKYYSLHLIFSEEKHRDSSEYKEMVL